MPLFRNKPKVIDAVQFKDNELPPRGVRTFKVDSGYRTFFVITNQERKVSVVVGDWIVDEGDGKHFYPIDNDTFTGPKGYDPI